MEEKRKIFLVQGYHHCHIGSALQEYLKGLGEYSVESIDMYDIEPERIGFGEADIVILTMGVEPEKGWRLNQSLLLAVARQESSFSPHASSPAGAKGLLQLLPNTAYHITKDKSLRRDCRPLYKAEYNLELGQQYIEYLLDKPFINGNLFYMLVAYNAGPGNLYKWLKTIKDNNDPLLFIELVPSRETRLYIERVMANYWIYQIRLQEKNQTLKDVIRGKWPMLKRS